MLVLTSLKLPIILSLPVISKDQIETAHALLVKLSKSFEHLYSAQYCTPNMHMACHLKQVCLILFPCHPFGASLLSISMENLKDQILDGSRKTNLWLVNGLMA